jgi:hypothetical protein
MILDDLNARQMILQIDIPLELEHQEHVPIVPSLSSVQTLWIERKLHGGNKRKRDWDIEHREQSSYWSRRVSKCWEELTIEATDDDQ